MKKQYITVLAIAAMIMILPTSALGLDAPAMWMEQNGDNIDLIINTSAPAMGMQAEVFFNDECINISDVDFTGSPWQPFSGPGWSHGGDIVNIALSNMTNTGTPAGEYKVAELAVDCVGSGCTSLVEFGYVVPAGMNMHSFTYVCEADAPDPAVVSIGNGTGIVTLPINVSSSIGVGSAHVILTFNTSVVNVTGVTVGDMDSMFINDEHIAEGWIGVGGYQTDNEGLMEFTMASIEFEPVSSNDQCPLELNVIELKDATSDTVPIEYTLSNGTYMSSLNGDADENGIVDMADAAYIAKHTIGLAGYETIDDAVSDVDGDGVVSMSDAMYLAKHIIGLSGFDELR